MVYIKMICSKNNNFTAFSEVFEVLYVIASIIFAVVGCYPAIIFGLFYLEYDYNLFIFYLTCSVPFIPIVLYLIILLFRKIKKKRQ